MKGSVHRTVAQFSFLADRPNAMDSWLGPRPPTRHLEQIAIPEMVVGSTLHIFSIVIPGFALRQEGVALPSGPWKPTKLVEAYAPNMVMTIDFVLVQGEWKPIAASNDGHVAVGLLDSSHPETTGFRRSGSL
jgi:hypothetical protein